MPMVDAKDHNVAVIVTSLQGSVTFYNLVSLQISLKMTELSSSSMLSAHHRSENAKVDLHLPQLLAGACYLVHDSTTIYRLCAPPIFHGGMLQMQLCNVVETVPP